MFSSNKKEISEQEALSKLSALCSRSEHSSGEMREKMRRWQLPPDAAERVLERLVADRYVDDSRYCRLFVRDKLRFDRWGRRKIEQALYRKGVDTDVINAAIAAVTDEEWLDALRPLVAAKRRTLKAADPYEASAKIMRFAIGRGFDMRLVRQCVADADDFGGDDF